MTAVSKASSSNWQEEQSCYAPLWQWRVVCMALDHFFADVVEGNVPLTKDGEDWWDERVIPERVTRYHKQWALVFEGLAGFRQNLSNNVAYELVTVTEALEFTTTDRRRGGEEAIEWKADDEG